MTLDLILIAAASIAGLIGTIMLVTRDGYRRVPTRQQ